MDLHIVGPAPTPTERAAIDAVLDPVIGPARSGWEGGTRDAARDGRSAHGGHEARARRDLLLPALNAAAASTGWVSRGALNHISARLSVPPADAYGVASFYALTATTPRPPIVAHVCIDLACRLAGATAIADDLAESFGPAGATLGDTETTWYPSPCLGQCERAPAILVTVAGPEPGGLVVGEIDSAEAVVDTLGWASEVADEGPARIRAELHDAPAEPLEWVRGLAPQAGEDGLLLLERVGRIDPTSLDAYRAAGGYQGLARAMAVGAPAVI
ncbi:MAG TPA: NAD(P)H-dependent oxidoreductase subunit E, partial [Candidatus Limnocylindrales bacterium]|nr:NAD(P)H-dependent oxidoreductase subunit E [Candidatus Limnocylindrales bacterium]